MTHLILNRHDAVGVCRGLWTHSVVLNRPRHELQDPIDWCAEQYGDTGRAFDHENAVVCVNAEATWYYLLGGFHFKTEDQAFEFKMRWF